MFDQVLISHNDLDNVSDYLTKYLKTPPGIIIRSEQDLEKYNITSRTLVVFTGGQDIATSLYGETPNGAYATVELSSRDKLDLLVYEKATQTQCVILGICRGAQFLWALRGGKILQHIEGHEKEHPIYCVNGRNTILATSSHHQGMVLPKLIAEADQIYRTFLNSLTQYVLSVIPKKKESIPTMHQVVEFFMFRDGVIGFQGHPEYPQASEEYKIFCATKIGELA